MVELPITDYFSLTGEDSGRVAYDLIHTPNPFTVLGPLRRANREMHVDGNDGTAFSRAQPLVYSNLRTRCQPYHSRPLDSRRTRELLLLLKRKGEFIRDL